MSTQHTQATRVARKLRGMPASDGAGVKLTRIIGTPQLDMLDPFLMLDEFGTDQPDDYLAGFPEHPHRGFETVTYMLDGRMRHKDNHGNEGLLVPGSVQWMTAGRGLVHSEMPEQHEGRMRGFQLWVNLPARDKMVESRYQEFAPDDIPDVTPFDGVRIKVIAGKVDDVTGPHCRRARHGTTRCREVTTHSPMCSRAAPRSARARMHGCSTRTSSPCCMAVNGSSCDPMPRMRG